MPGVLLFTSAKRANAVVTAAPGWTNLPASVTADGIHATYPDVIASGTAWYGKYQFSAQDVHPNAPVKFIKALIGGYASAASSGFYIGFKNSLIDGDIPPYAPYTRRAGPFTLTPVTAEVTVCASLSAFALGSSITTPFTLTIQCDGAQAFGIDYVKVAFGYYDNYYLRTVTRAAGSAVSYGSTTNSWVNVSNILTDNSAVTRLSAAVSASAYDALQVTNFGFSISADADVCAISFMYRGGAKFTGSITGAEDFRIIYQTSALGGDLRGVSGVWTWVAKTIAAPQPNVSADTVFYLGAFESTITPSALAYHTSFFYDEKGFPNLSAAVVNDQSFGVRWLVQGESWNQSTQYYIDSFSITIAYREERITEIKSSEYVHEIRSVSFVRNVSVAAGGGRNEYDHEIQSNYTNLGIVLDPTEGAEYDHEISSVFIADTGNTAVHPGVGGTSYGNEYGHEIRSARLRYFRNGRNLYIKRVRQD